MCTRKRDLERLSTSLAGHPIRWTKDGIHEPAAGEHQREHRGARASEPPATANRTEPLCAPGASRARRGCEAAHPTPQAAAQQAAVDASPPRRHEGPETTRWWREGPDRTASQERNVSPDRLRALLPLGCITVGCTRCKGFSRTEWPVTHFSLRFPSRTGVCETASQGDRISGERPAGDHPSILFPWVELGGGGAAPPLHARPSPRSHEIAARTDRRGLADRARRFRSAHRWPATGEPIQVAVPGRIELYLVPGIGWGRRGDEDGVPLCTHRGLRPSCDSASSLCAPFGLEPHPPGH